ncbi:MAG TPA: hypothetical protein VNN74_01245 [Candidatus Micrarchaeia archaeon]|nr:hypothetical protein [Candidatus Micrarchaeia archaeon]
MTITDMTLSAMTVSESDAFARTRGEIVERELADRARSRVLRECRAALGLLDRVLADLEDARIRERRVVPPAVAAELRHAPVTKRDRSLAAAVATQRPSLDRVQDAVLDAQGRLMTRVSRILGQPDWEMIEAEEMAELEAEGR